MDGWVFLPRYVDKIRLHLAGRLDPEYVGHLGRNSDGLWLRAAGVAHDTMVEVVRNSITDGEVCDWVRRNVLRSPEEKERFRRELMEFPDPGNPRAVALFEDRKAAYGLAHRADVRKRPDLLDADEGRM